MIFKLFLRGLLGLICLFLVGCPSDLAQLEQAYFSDKYFLTLKLISEMELSKSNQKKVSVFLKQNHKTLEKEILNECKKILAKGYARETVDQVIQARRDALKISKQFPNKISEEFLKNFDEQVEKIKDRSIQQLKYLSKAAANAKLHRKGIEHINHLQILIKLNNEEEKRLDNHQKQVSRNIIFFPVLASDETITEVVARNSVKMPHENKKNQRDLYQYDVNIPVVFERYIEGYLENKKSEYLTFYSSVTKNEQAHYYLFCRLNISEVISEEKLLYEESYIQYRHTGERDWRQSSMEYELYEQEKAYKLMVDSELRLPSTNKKVGHFIFEVDATQTFHRVGDFLNMPVGVSEVIYPADYLNYKSPGLEIPEKEYILKLIQDAGQVLTIKLLNVIDKDLDPWILDQAN